MLYLYAQAVASSNPIPLCGVSILPVAVSPGKILSLPPRILLLLFPPSSSVPGSLCFCCPVCGLCQERGAFSLAGMREMDTEMSTQLKRACALLLLISCLLLATRKSKKNKYFYLNSKKGRKLKARSCISCSGGCCFASG